jgi:hypothetical protein
MSKYPLIVIPGRVLSKKNNPDLHCLPTGQKRNYKSKRHCFGTMRPGISDGIDKATKDAILAYMRRCWGLQTITGPVNAQFHFFVAKYPELPGLAGRDLSNSYELYQDLMQADQYKVPTRGQYKGLRCLASSGAGIIENDSLIQGHNGSRFIYLCRECDYGFTGERRSPVRNKVKTGCPGSTKCPHRRIEIQLTDMRLVKGGFYENKVCDIG